MSDDTKRLHVTFFTKAVEDKAATREAGLAQFKDVEMVRILIPGDRNRTQEAPAHTGSIRDPETNRWLTYAERFPEHYAAFKANQEQTHSGTPLSELPFLTEAKRKNLQSYNVHTAETLAELDGAAIDALGMGARAMKNQAVAWLEKAKDAALEMKLAAENADLKEQMARMQDQISELASGKPPAPVKEEVPVSETTDPSPFEDWADDDIKAFIKDRSGEGVRGTPTHETLVAKADAILAAEDAAAQTAQMEAA